MNWSRGFFRLWLTVSILWVAGVTWAGYINVIEPRNKVAAEHACFEARRLNPAALNPFDCFEGNTTPAPPAGFVADQRVRGDWRFDDLVPLSFHWHYILIALLPVLIVLLLGMALRWIVAGFRRTTT